MELYPPPTGNISFDQMKRAAHAVINKEKSYPKRTINGMDGIAFEVYSNRIFAFRFVKLFRTRGLLGGSISRLGLYLQYDNHETGYTWDKITKLTITRTSFVGAAPNSIQGQYFFYDITIRFYDDTGINFNTQVMRFPEFPKMIDHGEWKLIGDLFALYYNRARQEKMQKVIHNGNKRVLLHEDVDNFFAQQMIRRFNSSTGLMLKYYRKRVNITKEGIKFLKGKKKVISEIKWSDFDRMIIGKSAVSPVVLLINSKNPDTKVASFYPNNYKFEPKDKSLDRKQMMHILPICWLSI